jgi:hypothetical protein
VRSRSVCCRASSSGFLPLPLAREVSTLRALAQLHGGHTQLTQPAMVSTGPRRGPPAAARGRPSPLTLPRGRCPPPNLLIFRTHPLTLSFLDKRPPSVLAGRRVGLFTRRLGTLLPFGTGGRVWFLVFVIYCGSRFMR